MKSKPHLVPISLAASTLFLLPAWAAGPPQTATQTAPPAQATTPAPNSPTLGPAAPPALPSAPRATPTVPSQQMAPPPRTTSQPAVQPIPPLGQSTTAPLAPTPSTTQPPPTTTSANPQVSSPALSTSGTQAIASSLQPGQAVTLEQALSSAQANEPAFAAAVAASKSALLDRSIARSALLPQVVYHNQYLYTQPAQVAVGTGVVSVGSAPRFIANNAVHEYVSQGVATETLGLAQYTALARADAAAAVAAAELEVSRRGLTATVVSLFFTSATAQRKIEIQQRAADEAADFEKLTQQREAAGEAAHADAIKAALALQQRQRDLADAQLQIQKARLDLGVLLFADPHSPYTVSIPELKPVPARAEIDAAAGKNNPEIRSALASLRAKAIDISAARAGFLPDLAFNYSYGIDAPQFAVHGPEGERNLGYSASATLDIPVWDWFATANKLKQARIQRDAAKTAVTVAQRRLLVNLDESYGEAVVAYNQLESLQLSVNTARESLHLTRIRYTAGEATVLEVVDAENSLTTAELAAQDGAVRYHVALANLQLLTGTI